MGFRDLALAVSFWNLIFFMKLLCEKDTFSLCFRLHHRENGVQRLGTGSVLPESHIFHETAL